MKTSTVTVFSRVSAILAGAFIALAPQAAQSSNIVSNPGFEDTNIGGVIQESTMDNWTASGVTVGVNDVIGIDTSIQYGLAPHGGVIAATFFSDTSATGSGASLTQTLATVAGQAYNLTFWLANPIDDAQNLNNIFSVSWDGNLISLSGANLIDLGGGQYQVQGDAANWYQVTATGLVASGASTDLTFTARNNDWATLVDDVEVSTVPDNGTTLGLLGIAFLGLVLSLRKEERRFSTVPPLKP